MLKKRERAEKCEGFEFSGRRREVQSAQTVREITQLQLRFRLKEGTRA